MKIGDVLGNRIRAGEGISTRFVEAAVKEIVAKEVTDKMEALFRPELPRHSQCCAEWHLS